MDTILNKTVHLHEAYLNDQIHGKEETRKRLYEKYILPRIIHFVCRLTPMMKQRQKLVGGCHLNRRIPMLLEQSGFTLQELEASYTMGFKPASFNYRGTATLR
jgi:hypothetical protein